MSSSSSTKFVLTFLASLAFVLSSTAAAAYAGSFELPPSSQANYVSRRQSSPPSSPPQLNPTECSNASVQADFGTACLKKELHSQTPQNTRKKVPTPGRSRYFAVKPMMSQGSGLSQTKRKNSFGVKSPALSARELYASKGYPSFPVKSVRTVSGTNLNMIPAPPVNKFYRVGNSEEQPSQQLPSLTPILDPTAILTEDDEWRDADREQVVRTPETPPKMVIKTRVLPSGEGVVGHQNAQNQNGNQGQYSEELEMLQSLKRSLGVLSAQALNLKQRSVLLYREARRRKLYFFDALLSRTHSFLAEKTDETRNALTDIDSAINQIKVYHKEEAALEALKRTFYFYQNQEQPSTRYLRRMRKRNARNSKIDPRELDQLIIDALGHAKRMMNVVKELNEAMDEFEEQFNLPRFEPNRVTNFDEEGGNSVDGSRGEEF